MARNTLRSGDYSELLVSAELCAETLDSLMTHATYLKNELRGDAGMGYGFTPAELSTSVANLFRDEGMPEPQGLEVIYTKPPTRYPLSGLLSAGREHVSFWVDEGERGFMYEAPLVGTHAFLFRKSQYQLDPSRRYSYELPISSDGDPFISRARRMAAVVLRHGSRPANLHELDLLRSVVDLRNSLQ